MMKRKDYLDRLAEVAEELNEVIGLEPAIETENVTKSNLEDKIKEASTLIDWEIDEFSKNTMKVLEELGLIESGGSEEPEESNIDIKEPEEDEQEDEPEPEQEDEPDVSDEEVVDDDEEDDDNEPSLEEIVRTTERRKALKRLAKSEPEFELLRPNLKDYSNVESLREAMLAELAGNSEPQPEEASEEEQEPMLAESEETPEEEIEEEAEEIPKELVKQRENPRKKKPAERSASRQAMYLVRKWTCENPEISVSGLVEALKKEGLPSNVPSVTIRRNEMRHAVSIMKELGRLK